MVLFLYCFPSEFLVGLLPHEPVLIYFGAFHAGLGGRRRCRWWAR